MKEEVERWMNKVKEDFDTAEYNLKGGKISAGIFFLQQATEKALKSVLIKKDNSFPKIHDLIKLGKLAGVDKNLLAGCEKLSFVYTETRYPDTENGEYTDEEIEEYIKITKDIIKWTEEKLF